MTKRLNNLLGWLANTDPNGLWSEYLDDYKAACAEHGPVSEEDAFDIKLDMIREGSVFEPFEHEGITITDPTWSSCGRFEVDPDEEYAGKWKG